MTEGERPAENSRLKLIEERASAAKMKPEWLQDSHESPEQPTLFSYDGKLADRYLQISVPQQRESIPVVIADGEHAAYVLASKFDKFKRLSNYSGVWSSELEHIESVVHAGSIAARVIMWVLRLAVGGDSRPEGGDDGDDERPVDFVSQDGSLRIEIGLCSPEYVALHHSHGTDARPRHFRVRSPFGARLVGREIVIRIRGAHVRTHDEAIELLEKISNSLFFSIDLATGLAIFLRRRPPEREMATSQSRYRRKVAPIAFEYDREAMSLYWHARSATGLPLLRFLAFYQVLEYFFPRYSKLEAIRRARVVLKDPQFDIATDSSISRLLNTIRATGSSVYGGELDQLDATVASCVTIDEIVEYIESSPDRVEFYSQKKGVWRKLADSPIVLDRKPEIIAQVVRRIYRIRCRVVHTKDEERSEGLLLPHTMEAHLLAVDTQLLEFVAARVLIASSVPLAADVRGHAQPDLEQT